MDDATIQTTPVTAFDTHAQHTTPFSEINEEEQFSDRGETVEAFILSDDSPVPTDAAIASASSASSAEVPPFAGSSAEVSPVAASAFATHTARAAEADDALLELGDSTPMREASNEADDFILDLDDEVAFDSPAAHERAVAADDMFADDVLFAGSAPAAVATGERKFFTEPEVAESPAPNAATAPVMLAQEPESAPEPASEEVPRQLWEEPATDVSGFELESAPAVTESESLMPGASSFETATTFESEAAPVAEASSESQPVEDAVQESAPAAVVAVASEQSHAAMSPLSTLSPEMLDELVRRVIAQMSEQVVREVAWEVVPDLAERLIKQRLEEEKTRPTA